MCIFYCSFGFLLICSSCLTELMFKSFFTEAWYLTMNWFSFPYYHPLMAKGALEAPSILFFMWRVQSRQMLCSDLAVKTDLLGMLLYHGLRTLHTQRKNRKCYNVVTTCIVQPVLLLHYADLIFVPRFAITCLKHEFLRLLNSHTCLSFVKWLNCKYCRIYINLIKIITV
jgi:hypothetical protein